MSEETREEGVLDILRKCRVRDGDEKLTCVGGGADHQPEVDEVERILE